MKKLEPGMYLAIHSEDMPDTVIESFATIEEAVRWTLRGGSYGASVTFALVIDPVKVLGPCPICGMPKGGVHDADQHIDAAPATTHTYCFSCNRPAVLAEPGGWCVPCTEKRVPLHRHGPTCRCSLHASRRA